MTVAVRNIEPVAEQPCLATRYAILQQRFREFAQLSAFRPTEISIGATRADAEMASSDILALERKSVPILQDFADYHSEALGIDRDELQDRVNIIIDALSDMRGIVARARG